MAKMIGLMAVLVILQMTAAQSAWSAATTEKECSIEARLYEYLIKKRCGGQSLMELHNELNKERNEHGDYFVESMKTMANSVYKADLKAVCEDTPKEVATQIYLSCLARK